MDKLSITWFGHSTFLLRTPGGKRVLFDPWLTSNPSCPDALKKPPKADLILASHGHFDHIEDLLLVRARQRRAGGGDLRAVRLAWPQGHSERVADEQGRLADDRRPARDDD